MLALTDRPSSSTYQNDVVLDEDESDVREIHALTPPPARRREASWSSAASEFAPTASSEGFTTMSREFSALVIAGSTQNDVVSSGSRGSINSNSNGMTTTTSSYNSNSNSSSNNNNLAIIGEDGGDVAETNPLAIVADMNPISASPPRRGGAAAPSVQRVRKEEVDAKITAWQNAKTAKINNRYKREDAVINGWENEQVHKSTSSMKKVERKLEEKRAKALEKMQNEIARTHRKAEERRASAEAKRGTKVARVLEIANLMRAVGRPPAKRSFF